ncbi:uncharacterized protein [Dysidea avara]|uniref:uncharacterized protein n=1 Tax=Dysidea avara TaxID=196820 RepID=UPI00331E814D
MESLEQETNASRMALYVSLQEILALYFDYFRGKLLYIFTDFCYFGHWVVELARYLDNLGIGACGHQAMEQGLLFKIVASCEPDQKAADGCFSSGALGFDDDDKNITFATHHKLSGSQNVYGCDFTHTMCYQLDGPRAPCRLPEMPAKYRWQWKDIISTISNPGERTFVVRGRDKGRKAWHFVVVPGCLVESFKAATTVGVVGVSDYGFSVASGFGDAPPDDILKKLIRFAPSYYN